MRRDDITHLKLFCCLMVFLQVLLLAVVLSWEVRYQKVKREFIRGFGEGAARGAQVLNLRR